MDAATIADLSSEPPLVSARARAAEVAPELEEARLLDRQLADHRLAADALTEEQNGRDAALRDADATWAAAQLSLSEALSRRDAEEAWVQHHAARNVLDYREAEILEALSAYEVAVETRPAAETGLGAAMTAGTEARATAERCLADRDQTEINLANALRRSEELTKTAPESGAESALSRRREGIAANLSHYQTYQNSRGGRTVLIRHIERDQEQLTAAEFACTAAESRLSQIASCLPTLDQERHGADLRRGISASFGSEIAARLRASLVVDEPCPVCGSKEHPLDSVEAMLRARIDDDQADFERIDGEHRKLGQEQTSLVDRLADQRSRARTAALELGERTGELAVLDQTIDREWRALLEALASTGMAPVARDDADSIPAIISVALSALDEERDALEEVRLAISTAAGSVEGARLHREKALADLEAATHAARSAEERQRTAGETLDRIAGAMTAAADMLDLYLLPHVEWRSVGDPRAQVIRVAAEWRDRRKALEILAGALPALSDGSQGAALARQTAAGALTAVRERALSLGREARDVEVRRLSLLDGQGVFEVERGLQQDIAVAELARDTARSGLAAARTAFAAAAAHEEAGSVLEARERMDAYVRSDELTQKLAAIPMDVSEVQAVARLGAPELDAEQERLAAIDRVVAAARATLLARRDDLAAHRLTPPEDSVETIAAALPAARLAADTARSEHSDAAFIVRVDDNARIETAALRDALTRRREAARVWEELDELIGDATGARFRRFAQGLTLDRLVALANLRLADLKPRYSLERGQGGDMLVQVVDHDMAGEVRGLHNLSGGERFLVSLALALGLSEMSSTRGLRIESLFIDEGFGALDGESLDSAISMLEQLHATGRRVGIISHIEDVKERIAVKIEVEPIGKGRSVVRTRIG
jgi:exonuclease SbcC